MNFKELSQVIPAVLDSGISMEIRSAPGRGKSEFIEQTVERMSQRDGKRWGFATCFLATMTPSDLLGYMMPQTRQDGVMVSQFTLPPWMQTVDGKPVTQFERGILFLDEFGQGEADVKRAAAELLLNRRLGPHALPRGWSVIAASNRSSDRSGVTKSFDFVINRRIEINITDDLAAWEDWAWERGVHPTFITFANQNSQVVFADGVPEKQGPWCTPRSLVMCSKLLGAMADEHGNIPTDAQAIELAGGLIGQGAAAQLFAMIRLGQEMPKYQDIVSDPKGCRVPDKTDARMLVCFSLAARVTEDDVDPVVTYVERFPKEYSVTFAKAAVRRDRDLINTAAFGSWAVRNASLMAAVVDRR
jgi:hypothetical protein